MIARAWIITAAVGFEKHWVFLYAIEGILLHVCDADILAGWKAETRNDHKLHTNVQHLI